MLTIGTLFKFAVIGSLLASCESGVGPPHSCNCPKIKRSNPFGLIPPLADVDPRVSKNGTYLSYDISQSYEYVIQNILDGSRFSIDMRPFMRENEELYLSSVEDWCPYDDDVVLIGVRTMVARRDDPSQFDRGTHFLKYNVRTKQAERITPSEFGDTTNIPLEVLWLPQSRPGNDVLRFNGFSTSALSPYRLYPRQFFVQTDSLYRDYAGIDVYNGPGGDVLTEDNNVNPTVWEINGKVFDNRGVSIFGISWSRSGRYLAVSPSNEYHFKACAANEVWIYDLDQTTVGDPNFVINVYADNCLFTTWGIQGSFLTDSTLLVEAHEFNATHAFLFESDLNGTLIRQVTAP